IVNFSLAKRYHHPVTGNHIPFHWVQCVRGTPAFSSIHAHLGAKLGHCNDLESLAYMLIYLVCGSLPWLSEDRHQQVSSILKMKQKTTVKVCTMPSCSLSACNIPYLHLYTFIFGGTRLQLYPILVQHAWV
ncbi:hypothetical protein J3A83DRAFT_4109259, partial [Scleroderma citrinum]